MNSSKEAYIALGANLGERQSSLLCALKLIDSRVGPLLAVSRFHESAALQQAQDKSIQPNYLNAVAKCLSSMPPAQVLKQLLEIETQLGRNRVGAEKWQARLIDLDLLGVEDMTIDTPELTLPHRELHKRDFVLVPLSEAAPNWVVPSLKKKADELLKDEALQKFII